MARNDPQLNLRLPADLKEKLEKLAKSNMRSLTAEVVARLSDSVYQLDGELIPTSLPTNEALEAVSEEFREASFKLMLSIMRKNGIDSIDPESITPEEEASGLSIHEIMAKRREAKK